MLPPCSVFTAQCRVIRSTHRSETKFCWWSLQLFLAAVLHCEQHIASQFQPRSGLCDYRLINMTNYPLPYSRWFSIINRFRNCQVWLLVSTSKYFRDRRFQGKRSRNDESAWTNYLHVICVLMLNIEPHILSISVCFSLESSVSYMNMDILQNRTGTVRILTLCLTITVIPNLLPEKHRFLLISL